jgi:hypothetical protein
MLPLILGGVLVLVIVGGAVGGGIWWYSSSKSKGDKDKQAKEKEKEKEKEEKEEKASRDDLEFVHDAATEFQAIRVAELWKFESVRKKQAREAKDLDTKYGLQPEDVERLLEVTVPQAGPNEPFGHWTVILTRGDVNQQKVKEKLVGDKGKEVKQGDKTFFESGKPGSRDCVYFHGSRVLIHADSQATMKRALDGYPRKKTDGIIANAVRRAGESKTVLVGVHQLTNQTMVLTLNGSTVSIEMIVSFPDEAQAGAMKPGIEQALQQQMKVAEQQPGLSEEDKKAIRSMQITQKGKDIVITASTDLNAAGGLGGLGGVFRGF